MISASLFSRRAASFWQNITPTSESFTRRINSELYHRRFPPLASEIPASSVGYVNEVAFDAFSICVMEAPKQVETLAWPLADELLDRSARAAWARLNVYRTNKTQERPMLSCAENSDIQEQFSRLLAFFKTDLIVGCVVPRPLFSGCGIIDMCAGDVLTGDCLYEVKAGRRSFRSADLRQILVYAALYWQKTGSIVNKIGLFNPRTGMSFVAGLDVVCFEISGRSSRQLLSEIVEATSTGGISR